jgi:hypothetical protein
MSAARNNLQDVLISKGAQMPIEVTTYLSATASSEETSALDYLLELNEGHHSPVWQWVLPPGEKLVPSAAEQVLFEGLAMLAEKVSGQKANTAAEINTGLAGWNIAVTADQASIALSLFDDLAAQGINLAIRLVRI